MNTLIISIACLLGYTAFYTILDRVCKCCEYCAMVKAYGKACGGKTDVGVTGVSNKAD